MRKSLVLLTLLPAVSCHAQNALKSAPQILASLPKVTEQDSGEVVVPTSPSIVQWRRDVLGVRQNSGKNSAAQNAKIWLELSQRRLVIPRRDTKTYAERPPLSELAKALPAPDQWPQLLKAAQANYKAKPTQVNAANWAFAARLQNDSQQQVEALRALHRIVAPRLPVVLKKYPVRSTNSYIVSQNEETREQELGDCNGLAALLRDSPSPAQQTVGLKWQLELTPRTSVYEQLNVPDLVAQMGEKVATPLVRQMLLSPARLQCYSAGKTTDLARRLWLSEPQLQTRPQWDLADSYKQGNLALVMINKFGQGKDKENLDWGAFNTRAAALGGLLAQEKFSFASQKVAQWIKSDGAADRIQFPSIDEEQPHALQIKQLQWIKATLKQYPQLRWGGGYSTLSLRLGQTPNRLAWLKSQVAQKGFANLPASRRHNTLEALSAAYLNVGDTKNGGDTLVRALQISLAKPVDISEAHDEITSLLRLTRIAPNPHWLQAAEQGTISLVKVDQGRGDEERQSRQLMRLALRFAEQKQAVFGQSLIIDAWQDHMKARAKDNFFGNSTPSTTYLYGLMQIYQKAGRAADMVYLLQHAPGWGEEELTPLLTFNGSSDWEYDVENPESKTSPRLGYLAAWALARTNQRAQAIQVLHALLERQGGYDAAYRLLCDLQGEAARPFLKQLAATDRFEERPLIWQAYLSRHAGKWSQAQQLAQQAIAIDPSDGEEGPGDRLRAYDELSAALRGQKKTGEAEKVEGAVRSIRLAERADYLRIAGLTLPAIEMYKQSLRYFDDAYCIQSRLAVQLTSQGRYAEASQHFRRAYELMPVSFGRLESHCFGCEGVFGGQEQNSIARDVFLQLEKARPNDPKIAYLSGYWRMTARQRKEAAHYFERAVSLDPLYLSAWKQLSGMSEVVTPQQSDRATLALLRLDPRGVHSDNYVSGVSYEVKRDYRGLWKTTQAVLPRKTLRFKANFPLHASQVDNSWSSSDYDTWALVKKPADAIAGQEFVRHVAQVM